MVGELSITGNVNIEFMQKSFEHIINKHLVFKAQISSFFPKQRIVKNVTLNIELIKLDANSDVSAVVNYHHTELLLKRLTLNKPPLLYMKLISSADNKSHYLLAGVPHIISDAYSLYIFLQDFIATYNKLLKDKDAILPLPEYNDYYEKIIKDRDFFNKNSLKLIGFWEEYARNAKKLTLSFADTDFNRGYINNNFIFTKWNQDSLSKFKQIAERNNISLNKALGVATGLLLSCFIETDKIYLYNIVFGRENPKLKKIIGCLFQNELWGVPVNKEGTLLMHFSEFLKEEKRVAEYQNAPMMVKLWALDRNYFKESWEKSYFFRIGRYCARRYFSSSFDTDVIDRTVKFMLMDIKNSAKIFLLKIKRNLFKINTQDQLDVSFCINVIPPVRGLHKMVAPTDFQFFVNEASEKMPLIAKNIIMMFFFLRADGTADIALNGVLTEHKKKQFLQAFVFMMDCLMNNEDIKISTLLQKLNHFFVD